MNFGFTKKSEDGEDDVKGLQWNKYIGYIDVVAFFSCENLVTYECQCTRSSAILT